MSTPATDQKKKSGSCWTEPRPPAPELLAALKDGTLSKKAGKSDEQLQARIALLRREKVEKPVFFVGAGTCGLGAGAGKTLEKIRQVLAEKHIDAEVREVGCVGLCSEEPIVDVQLPGWARVSFGNVTADKLPSLLDCVLGKSIPKDMVLGQFKQGGGEHWKDVPYLEDHPFLVPQKRLVLANSGIIDPTDIDTYIACGGYSALFTVLREKTPMEVCDIIETSGLRGRGGGGFPTGKKWKFARGAPGDVKYLICNADEGDPGAFMDRAVGESDPHRLIEGMIIAAYAIGATKAYIYIRAEYPLAIKRLEQAIEQAMRYGLLGENILGSGFKLQIVIKMGAGAFVCGEETALIHSIEGKRGMPRPRPPYPAVKGLFGKPTVINNVETLANLPSIIQMGGEAFAAMGTPKSKGTKVFALSGMVNRTGLVEVPMGTTLREVVFNVGGGIPNGKKCKGVQIGGPSGGCIPEKHMDIPTDYEALKEFGAIMGSGGLVVLDENTCMVDLAKFFMEFIHNESCGKCIPCREGTKRMLEIHQAITRGRKREENLDTLLRFQGIMYMKRLSEVIRSTSLCGLGQTAPNPVLSTLRWFREEYEAHIFERRCPSGSCKELVGAPCQTGCPVGTEVWRYVAHIAKGQYDEAYRVIRQANPFPSVCARVCHHPCEVKCRAGATGGEPIAVRTLKRFVVDRVDPAVYTTAIKVAAADAPRVAVIGAGPAGLSAASYLGAAGYRVTLFEKECQPGGMLISAIPAYRLPRARLQQEIDSLLNQNIELRCNVALGREITIDKLFQDGYKAVYLAIGSHLSRKLGVPGEDGVKNVLHGIQFLKAYNLRNESLARGHVGIIGGGNSALDAARVAFRQPEVSDVTIFYRRTREEMPAYAEEIEAAIEEGIRIETLVGPVEILSADGQLKAVRFLKNTLGERDESGRARPIPVAGSEYDVELDTLIIAISEEPETQGLAGMEVSKKGTLTVNPESFITSRPGVFGGGDVVTGPNTVIEAVAAGKQAGMMIGRFLSGKQLKVLPKVKLPEVYIEPLAGAGDEEAEASRRVHPPHLAVGARRRCFAEVELAIDENDALLEARRCLRCDLDFTQPA